MVDFIIYKITNPIGQIYIGQTNNIKKRLRFYFLLKCKGQKLLYKSLKHYGYNNHVIEILHSSVVDDLDEQEKYYIEKENSYYWNNKEFGLNLSLGGNTNRGYKHTDDFKIKQRHRYKGIKRDPCVMNRIYNQRRKNIKDGIIFYNGIKVLQYDLNEEFIKEWPSIASVCRFLKITDGYITKVLSKRPYIKGGFKWIKKKTI